MTWKGEEKKIQPVNDVIIENNRANIRNYEFNEFDIILSTPTPFLAAKCELINVIVESIRLWMMLLFTPAASVLMRS